MGNFFSNIFPRFCGKRPVGLLMFGLDSAGKTTILYKLRLGEVVTTFPTTYFNLEMIEYKNISFTVWDITSQEVIRRLWKHFLEHTMGLIFVVESSDRERIQEAASELHKMLEEDELREAAVLVLANKQDLQNAMPVHEMTEKLGLHEIKGRPCYIQTTCAINGDGLYEGLDWMADQISKH